MTEVTHVDDLVTRAVRNLKMRVAKQRKIPDRVLVGSLQLERRERYALRRYTRQLKSEARAKARDAETVYCDPSLAISLISKGLVETTPDRKMEQCFLLPRGEVVWFGRPDSKPEHHIPTWLTAKGRAMLDALTQMQGD